MSDRCSYDLQLSTEIRWSPEDYPAQIAIQRRQTVRADVRVRQSATGLHGRRQVTAGAQGQTVRLHRGLPVRVHYLNRFRATTG